MTPADITVTRWGVRFLHRRFACTVGRAGIVAPRAKREGDGATPAGVHRIVGMLYRPDRMARPADWALPIGPADLWSDDPKDEDYNLMVRAPHRFSHERLRRADPMYDLILITDWNWPQSVAGRGSAIFVHAWRRPHARTAGCVALSPAALRWIAPRITHGTRLIIRG
ncbi:L,D-transpeptidase family protein [Tabrizicola sp.]|uniref:L,D-transpeptidase family protein n=1 Tax=Tabrizicola sp. TaxID=2005166 RepID=UPI00286CD56E|nr:L,D-transpeptidase family protein [Tabrizicola sp.]